MIEAKWLFDLENDQIDVVIHPSLLSIPWYNLRTVR